jgi:hypothetical protein
MLKQIFDMMPDGIIGPFSIASIAAKQQMNTTSETIYLYVKIMTDVIMYNIS